ncbi:MAG: CPBP family intramembrane glutamic endopeptidase [Eubacterium sp.]|jgi:membrane protease YdiL (CAAX protease family)
MLNRKILRTGPVVKIILFALMLGFLLVWSSTYQGGMDRYLLIRLAYSAATLFVGLAVIRTTRMFEGRRLSKTMREITLMYMLVFCLFYLAFFFGLPINIYKTLKLEPKLILWCAELALCAGLSEEVMFRFVLADGFAQIFKNSKHMLLLTSIVSSIIFGTIHLNNLSGTNTLLVIEQVVSAFVVGLSLCIVRMLFDRLWPVVLIHTLIDFQPSIVQPLEGEPFSVWAMLYVYGSLLILNIIALVLMDDKRNSQLQVEY